MTFSLGQIAEQLGLTLVGDAEQVISKIAPFEKAGEQDVSFITNAKYLPLLESWFKSDCDNEKKATSVPDISAEHINKIINVKLLINISRSNFNAKNRNMEKGSESKFLRI